MRANEASATRNENVFPHELFSTTGWSGLKPATASSAVIQS
jgi:hypothetical protein